MKTSLCPVMIFLLVKVNMIKMCEFYCNFLLAHYKIVFLRKIYTTLFKINFYVST